MAPAADGATDALFSKDCGEFDALILYEPGLAGMAGLSIGVGWMVRHGDLLDRR
jgi:hypothetical protein